MTDGWRSRRRGRSERRESRFRFSTRRLRFRSGGIDCVGTLTLPDGPSRPPVVVLANGAGFSRRDAVVRYAERFAAHGYAAFTFDYRGFGDSGGEPRRLIDPERQLSDLRAALAGVRQLDEVNGRKIALWGFSLGGGHAVAAAATDRRVSAVVAQQPLVDGRVVLNAHSKSSLGRAFLSGVRDRIGGLVGRPYEVPLVGDPDEFALLNAPTVRADVEALVSTEWENATPARVVLTIRGFRPISVAADVTVPTLFVSGRADDIVPADLVGRAAQRTPNATLLELPGGHFDSFSGRAFDHLVGHELAFLEAHVGH